MIKQVRPGVTLFLVGVLVGMVILVFCRLVISELIVLLALVILAVLWIFPAWLGNGHKALKTQASQDGKNNEAAARSCQKVRTIMEPINTDW